MPYNPFDKPIGEKLDCADLQLLIQREVSEGYTVEYKQNFPSNIKIAHSIASFANTNGGWYIVGVKTNEHHAACEICGFDLDEHPDPIAKVREVIKANIDPLPIFYHQLIKINDAKAVFVLFVPGDQETPFITKDGRIYRRIADSSDPMIENNRYALDRLVDHGREIGKEFDRFCEDYVGFVNPQEKSSSVILFISPYPYHNSRSYFNPTDSQIDALIKLSQAPIKIEKPFLDAQADWNMTGHAPFNHGQTSYDSIILRQILPADIVYNSLSVQFFTNGRAKFNIPIQFNYELLQQRLSGIKNEKVRSAFRGLWNSDQHGKTKSLRFIDVGTVWLAITTLLSYYLEFYALNKSNDYLRISAHIIHAHNTVPFDDSDEWADHVSKFGFPVIKMDNVLLPPKSSPMLIMTFQHQIPVWLRLCHLVGLSMGLPGEYSIKNVLRSLNRAVQKSAANKV